MLVKFANALPSSLRGTTAKASLIRKLRLAAFTAIALAGLGCGAAHAENPDISSRRAAERTDFTNDEIREGFFKIAFGAELQIDKPADRVRKFDEPIRIFVESHGMPDRRAGC